VEYPEVRKCKEGTVKCYNYSVEIALKDMHTKYFHRNVQEKETPTFRETATSLQQNKIIFKHISHLICALPPAICIIHTGKSEDVN
jgi:radical SAM superfamily enzyme